VPGRASGIVVGMEEMGALISLDGWQSIWIVGVSACVISILRQKIQKMAKCTFWYQLTLVVLDEVERAVKWLCVLAVADVLDRVISYICDRVCVCVCVPAVKEKWTVLSMPKLM